ncbi:MAG TPA: DUF2795 domain-containing protein [Ktedonobacterales bacterium]|jgi:hypothetical protein
MTQHTSHDGSTSGGKRISPISLQKHLKGTSYPATKQDLVRRAESNQAPDDVLEVIRHLPQESYDSPAAVMRSFGQVQ